MKILTERILFYIIIAFLLFLEMPFRVTMLQSQDTREQKPGKPKQSNIGNFKLQGSVLNKETGQPVSNADITVKESSAQKVISTTKSNTTGNYEVNAPKGLDLEVKAQAPEYFFDAFKLKVGLDDPQSVVEHNFMLTSELRLRINFPSNQYDNPYPYVLDDDGIETNQFWQSSLNSVAEDIIRYKDNLSKVILAGHTDDVGNSEFNLKLGQNRVDFIKSELQKRGVSEMLIETKSSGKEELLVQGPGEEKEVWRKRCRRVVMSKVMK